MKTPIPKVGLRFLVFGPLELTAALLVGNSAIATTGMDNLFDGIYMSFFGRIDDRLANSSDHRLYCKLRGWLGIVSSLVGIVMIGFGLLLEHHNQADLTQMITGLVLGGVGVYLTLKGHHEIVEHGDEHHGGFDAHLMQDMASSVIAALSGVLAYSLDRAAINLYGGILILGLATVIGLRKSRQLYKKIDHTDEEHNHDPEPDEFHRRHSPAATS